LGDGEDLSHPYARPEHLNLSGSAAGKVQFAGRERSMAHLICERQVRKFFAWLN
jgi:hypothetical protein